MKVAEQAAKLKFHDINKSKKRLWVIQSLFKIAKAEVISS